MGLLPDCLPTSLSKNNGRQEEVGELLELLLGVRNPSVWIGIVCLRFLCLFCVSISPLL